MQTVMPYGQFCLPISRSFVLSASNSALTILASHPAPDENPWGQVRELYGIVTATESMLTEVRQLERERMHNAIQYLSLTREMISKAWLLGSPGHAHPIDTACAACAVRNAIEVC